MPPQEPVRGYILAESRRQAILTAERDWRWKRIGREEFEHPMGGRVRIVTDEQHLRGLPDGTEVYRAYEWWKCSEGTINFVKAMLNSGLFVEP